MKRPEFKGISFGLVSAVITTIGIIISLDIGTKSLKAVILGVIVIAFADGLSDSLGVHISEESEKRSSKKIWKTTIYAFFSKFLFTLSFIIPLFLGDLAIPISIIYGLSLLAKSPKNKGIIKLNVNKNCKIKIQFML